MTQKEVSELRRRLQPEKTNITNIYGCYVNANKEIISYIDGSLGRMPEDEAEQYLLLLKKVLSGRLGKNLIDIVFSVEQVRDSEEHHALMALRDSALKDEAQRSAFYEKIIQSLDMGDSNYLILLAYDAYDVPYRKDGSMKWADGGDSQFRYILCAICPVKDGKLTLGYYSGENEFHNRIANQIVGMPEIGFLFPAFDDRAANIYNVLLYARKPEEVHHEFLNGVFKIEPPMTAAEQREAFHAALSDAGLHGMDLICALHEELLTKIIDHNEKKDAEPLSVSAHDIARILRDNGVSEQDVEQFMQNYAEKFGNGAVVEPENIIDSSRFQLKASSVKVDVDPECSDLITTRNIDGKTYILIPAEGEVEINGYPVRI